MKAQKQGKLDLKNKRTDAPRKTVTLHDFPI